ncbi:two component signal transduction response regulator [Candidatus Magnetoovum chiemensis]|nr:two component signal transduction response regulator [Candidatus Magnetoovum chiemensis]
MKRSSKLSIGEALNRHHKHKTCAMEDAFRAFSKIYDDYYTARKKKVECWEFMNCGYNSYSKCDAYTKKAGRRCWLVAGSLSGSNPCCIKVKTKEFSSCKECGFFSKIKKGMI